MTGVSGSTRARNGNCSSSECSRAWICSKARETRLVVAASASASDSAIGSVPHGVSSAPCRSMAQPRERLVVRGPYQDDGLARTRAERADSQVRGDVTGIDESRVRRHHGARAGRR